MKNLTLHRHYIKRQVLHIACSKNRDSMVKPLILQEVLIYYSGIEDTGAGVEIVESGIYRRKREVEGNFWYTCMF